MSVHLYWRMIPMSAIVPFAQTKGKDSFYFPYLGKGVYLFLLATTSGRYIVWYIGESNHLGKRWWEHVKAILSSCYWVPKNPDKFIMDPIGEINLEAFILPESTELEDNDRYEIGAKKILDRSYFCFAEVRFGNRIEREQIESLLLKGTKEHQGIKAHGWIGDRPSQRHPSPNLIVENIFESDEVEKTLGQSLPQRLP